MSRRTKVAFLASLFLLCLACAGLQLHRLRARNLTKPTELFDVIWHQVAAFRADDYAGAYQQVSMGFQERFNIEAFKDLIHSEYPPVRYAERIEFGAVQWDGQCAVVPVYFFLPEGEVIPCFYSFIHEEGSWKIDGVRVQKRWPPGRRLGGLRT
jgi:hypothetical protein